MLFLEIIFGIINEVLLNVTGGFIRWAISGFKKGKFGDFMLSKSGLNYSISISIIISIVLIVRYV